MCVIYSVSMLTYFANENDFTEQKNKKIIIVKSFHVTQYLTVL